MTQPRASVRRPGGIVAARSQKIATDKIVAALKRVEAGLPPTKAASQLGLGRSTVYREVASAAA